jgi:ABC-type nitrate/sulfonate/bicarbonate transport system substrate-binding protein
MRLGRTLMSVACLGAVSVLGSFAPAAHFATAAHGASAAKSKKKAAPFHHPNLKGQSITFIVAADPQISDVNFYDTIQILKSWGADVTLNHVTGEAVAMESLVSGGADIGEGQVDAAENAGAVIFGPKQPRTDYYMVAKKLTKVSQLPGHSFAVSNTAGLENLMYHLELKKYKIPESKVPEVLSGGASVRGLAVSTGTVDATFIHFDGWLGLKGQGLHILTTVAKDLPKLSDSFTLAMPSWLNDHPDLAKAYDEAYIEAAKDFHNRPAYWAALDGAYTSNADPPKVVQGQYKQLLKANLWPDDGSGFGTKDLTFNESVVKSIGAINSPKPLAQWGTTKYWVAAVKAVLHKKVK